MTLLRTALLAGVFTTTLAAQGEFKSWPISQAPAELRPAISRAELVVIAMHDAMLRELNDAFKRGGPSSAINSCHVDATGVAQRIGRQEGIAAGRTSDRLRSPMNAPRPWAAALVKAHAGRQARSVEGFAVDLGEKVGVLRPIGLRSMCSGCHGPVERLSPGVKAVLSESYPADRAVGFAEGEIRGWFWVEMPKRRQ
jgi:hypothetical protein